MKCMKYLTWDTVLKFMYSPKYAGGHHRNIAVNLDIEARIVGHVESYTGRKLTIQKPLWGL